MEFVRGGGAFGVAGVCWKFVVREGRYPFFVEWQISWMTTIKRGRILLKTD
jgi:hypothetical protein